MNAKNEMEGKGKKAEQQYKELVPSPRTVSTVLMAESLQLDQRYLTGQLLREDFHGKALSLNKVETKFNAQFKPLAFSPGTYLPNNQTSTNPPEEVQEHSTLVQSSFRVQQLGQSIKVQPSTPSRMQAAANCQELISKLINAYELDKQSVQEGAGQHLQFTMDAPAISHMKPE
ncbi:hypothetical protein GH733_007382 [Mirounga leonina]|nr:hypothetical protein GH733_007382 [Mirounga leonina]